MVAVSVQASGFSEAIKLLESAPSKISRSAFDEISRVTMRLTAKIKGEYLGGEVLHRRTGKLSRSVFPDVEISGNEVIGMVAVSAEYAAIHEFGGQVVARNAQYLTIPLPAALTAAGVMRYPRARDYPDTFVRKGVIFQNRGESVVPLFLLRKSVTIPKRPFMTPALESLRPAIESGMAAAVERGLAT